MTSPGHERDPLPPVARDHGRERRRPALSRRHVLRSAAAGLVLTAISRPGATRSRRQPPAAVTTLDRTFALGDPLVPGLPYRRLTEAPGVPIVVREELAVPTNRRARQRRVLTAFVHLTDLHVVDAASPAHPAFLRQYPGGFAGADFANAFRPQDPLTAHVVAAMIRRINAVAAGPVSGRPFDFAISTGDGADGRATHELQTLLALFAGGGSVSFNAAGTPYVGLQDASTDVPAPVYDAFWHPDPAPAPFGDDRWKREHGYPTLPGLLDAASQPIPAEGLAMPWYGGFGNHDAVLLGVLPDGSGPARFLERLAAGDQLPLALPPGLDVAAFLAALQQVGDDAAIAALIERMPRRTVPAAPTRRSFTRADFVRVHLEAGGTGPVGHGFSQANLDAGTAYYRFGLAPGVVGFMLDSTNPGGRPDGSLDPQQAAWLEAGLATVHRRYLDPAGAWVTTNHDDSLAVIFSHHNSRTFDNLTTAPGQTTSDRLGSAAFVALLQRFPNVVLWVNGHSHTNRVWPHPDPTGRTGGFWEVNTASHIDTPQQARTFELFHNGDGTLSVVSVMLDHADPSDVPPGPPYDPPALAALALELSSNDPAQDLAFRLGAPGDRNVELVLRWPYAQ